MRHVASLFLILVPAVVVAQVDHSAHKAMLEAQNVPTHAGQEAFATIAEIVTILKNDSATDWSRVNIEALRQHLIDMDDVTMRAHAHLSNVAGGVRVVVTGAGRTRDAIQRMTTAHSSMLNASSDYSSVAETIPDGVRLTVVAKDPAAAGVVARIRGLGFIGWLTEGSHHQLHHLAIARGEGDSAHKH